MVLGKTDFSWFPENFLLSHPYTEICFCINNLEFQRILLQKTETTIFHSTSQFSQRCQFHSLMLTGLIVKIKSINFICLQISGCLWGVVLQEKLKMVFCFRECKPYTIWSAHLIYQMSLFGLSNRFKCSCSYYEIGSKNSFLPGLGRCSCWNLFEMQM